MLIPRPPMLSEDEGHLLFEYLVATLVLSLKVPPPGGVLEENVEDLASEKFEGSEDELNIVKGLTKKLRTYVEEVKRIKDEHTEKKKEREND